jgi:hypothetical protein
MTAKVDSSCGCDRSCSRSGKGVSAKRAMCAGAFGGIVAIVTAVAVVAWLLRRFGPSMMPRMMRDCECSPEMQVCMEKCGCESRAEGETAS